MPRTLLAVLLNPPEISSGTRTRNAVKTAGDVLGFDSIEIVNLTSIATPTVLELNGRSAAEWLEARVDLAAGLTRAGAVLGGWGISGLSGTARAARRAQVQWFVRAAQDMGVEAMWTVGGEPRHPSRWHQYVADKYARTAGGTFADRLEQVLVVTTLAGPHG